MGLRGNQKGLKSASVVCDLVANGSIASSDKNVAMVHTQRWQYSRTQPSERHDRENLRPERWPRGGTEGHRLEFCQWHRASST